MKNINNNDDFNILTKELIIQKLKELKNTYLNEGFEIVGLFGSYAKNTQSKYSDIDIAYKINHEQCSKQYPNAFSKLIRIEEIQKELKSIFKREVDFVSDNNKKILDDIIYV